MALNPRAASSVPSSNFIVRQDLNVAELKVLSMLAQWADDRGESWKTNHVLVAATSLDDRRVRRALRSLEKKGLVSVRIARAGEHLPRMDYPCRRDMRVYTAQIPPWNNGSNSTRAVLTADPVTTARAVVAAPDSTARAVDADPGRTISTGPSSRDLSIDRNTSSSSPFAPAPEIPARGPDPETAIGAPPVGGAVADAPPVSLTSSLARAPSEPGGVELSGVELESGDRSEDRNEDGQGGGAGSRPSRRREARDVLAYWRAELWPKETGRPMRRRDVDVIERWLADGFDADELRDAIDGAKVSVHNSQKPTQRSLRSIFGTEEAVSTLAVLGRKGGAKRRSAPRSGDGAKAGTPPAQKATGERLTSEQQFTLGRGVLSSLDQIGRGRGAKKDGDDDDRK